MPVPLRGALSKLAGAVEKVTTDKANSNGLALPSFMRPTAAAAQNQNKQKFEYKDVKQSAAALAGKAVAELRANRGAASRKETKQRQETKHKETEEAKEAAKEAAAALRFELALSVEERKAAAEVSRVKMSNLSTAQLSSWGESDIHALSSADLAAMEPSQFRAFTAKQLALLKPQQIMQLGAKQLKALPADILQKLTPAMIGMLPDNFLHNLDEVQLASMSADQIGSMTSEQLESYNARQLARLDPAHLHAVESWSRGRDAAGAVAGCASRSRGASLAPGADAISTSAPSTSAPSGGMPARCKSNLGAAVEDGAAKDAEKDDRPGRELHPNMDVGAVMLMLTEAQLANMSEEMRAGAMVVRSDRLVEFYAAEGDGSAAERQGETRREWASTEDAELATTSGENAGKFSLGENEVEEGSGARRGDIDGDIDGGGSGGDRDAEDGEGNDIKEQARDGMTRTRRTKEEGEGAPPSTSDVDELDEYPIDAARRREAEWAAMEEDEIVDDFIVIVVPDPEPAARQDSCPGGPELGDNDDVDFECDADLQEKMARGVAEEAVAEAESARRVQEAEAAAGARSGELAEAARRDAATLAAPAEEIDDDGNVVAVLDEEPPVPLPLPPLLPPEFADDMPAEDVRDEECEGDGRDVEEEAAEATKRAAALATALVKAKAADDEVAAASARLALETRSADEIDTDESAGDAIADAAAAKAKGRKVERERREADAREAAAVALSADADEVEDDYGDADFNGGVYQEETATASEERGVASGGDKGPASAHLQPRVSWAAMPVDEDEVEADAAVTPARLAAGAPAEQYSDDDFVEMEEEEEILEEEGNSL